jgi:protein kinase-like protein
MGTTDNWQTLADLSGDPERDDALLLSLGSPLRGAEPLLSERDLLVDRRGHLESAYGRLTHRIAASVPDQRQSELLGVLGFCLLTERMLAYTFGVEGAASSQVDWDRRQRELNDSFSEPGVRDAFALLYDFPPELDLGSATIHRLGTTSFLLRCLSRSIDAAGPSALKCLLYPYLRLGAVVEATRGYADRYQSADPTTTRHMVRVYRATTRWVWMEFITGRTLGEALRAEARLDESPPPGLRSDRLKRYGLPLLQALHDVRYNHLDLSPSNIMIRDTEDPDIHQMSADIVLIDFGENHMLTQNVASGRISSETARYVAPELLESRSRGGSTGYEDVYSVGQILLELAGYDEADGGYIPTRLYKDTPLIGRLIEDLLDREPSNRLLLSGLDLAPPIEDDRRKAMYDDLRGRLTQALTAHNVMARVTPTLAPRDRAGSGWVGRSWAALASLAASLVLIFGTVAKPLQFRRIMRQGDEVGTEYGVFFRWAMACSTTSAIGLFLIIAQLRNATQRVGFVPGLSIVLHGTPPFVDLSALLRHYAPLPRGFPPGWDALPALLVALTFAVTATRYYLEIFSMLTVRRMRLTIGRRIVEVLTRMMSLGTILILPATILFRSQWLIFWGAAMLFIVANNFANWALASSLVARGSTQFSTIRKSDLADSVDTYAEWWKLMLAYGAFLCGLGVLIDLGVLKDLVLYAVLAIAVNMLGLYRGNCGKKAPGLRAALARAWATGERLEALHRRTASSGQPTQSGAPKRWQLPAASALSGLLRRAGGRTS